MWITFNTLEKQTFKGEKGEYDAYLLSGMKKGFKGAPDEDWSRKLFESDAASLIEDGMEIPGVSVIDFFKNGVEPGDLVDIKQEKDGKYWRILTMCNMSKGGNKVKPKSYEEAKAAAASSASIPAAPTPVKEEEQEDDVPPWAV